MLFIYRWLNGDIDYAINAPHLTILHFDKNTAEQYGDQVNIGVLDCELSQIRELRRLRKSETPSYVCLRAYPKIRRAQPACRFSAVRR